MILVVYRTGLLVRCPWTNLWKGCFINTNYYYYYYYNIVSGIQGAIQVGGMAVVWEVNDQWDRIEFFE